MSTKLIHGNCDDCGAEIKPAKTQSQFNRNVGLHRWREHGIASPKAEESRKYRLASKKKNIKNRLANVLATNGNVLEQEPFNGGNGKTFESLLSPSQRRRGRPTRHQNSIQSTQTAMAVQEETSSNAVPAKLPECPCCGTRFYMVKGGQ
jgi:hypothetical protein